MTAYVDVATIKSVMPDVAWGTGYDTILNVLATRASRLIDAGAGRDAGEFATGTAGTARYFDGSGTQYLWVDEMAGAPSKVEVAETGDLTILTTWAATDYIVWPYNRTPYRRLDVDVMHGTKVLWHAHRKGVKITAPWGFSQVLPDDLAQAIITQVIRWFKRGQQGFSDTGAIVELGQITYTKKLDPDIEMILESPGYIRRVV